jgi:hypothetical protein
MSNSNFAIPSEELEHGLGFLLARAIYSLALTAKVPTVPRAWLWICAT